MILFESGDYMTATVEFEAVDENSEIGLLSVPRHVAIIMDGNGRWLKAVVFRVLKGIGAV